MHGPGDISQTVAWAPVNQDRRLQPGSGGRGAGCRMDTPLDAVPAETFGTRRRDVREMRCCFLAVHVHDAVILTPEGPHSPLHLIFFVTGPTAVCG